MKLLASPMQEVEWLGDCTLALNTIILLCTGKTDDDIHAALRVMSWNISRLRVMYERLTCRSMPYSLRRRDGEPDVRSRLKKFYKNLKSEYHRERPRKANFVLEQ